MFRSNSIMILALAAMLACGAPFLLMGQGGAAQAADRALVSAVTELLNAERAKHGLGPLKADRKLSSAASRHAHDMAKRNYFAHKSPEGKIHADRISDAGYCRAATAENIAEGYHSAASVVKGWMGSPPHRKNMLYGKFVRFGISEYESYWVLTLAGPCV